MTSTPSTLSNITRPDVGFVLVGEWAVGTPERQRDAVDATMTAWRHVPWPEGLLSYTSLVSTDGNTVLHYSQWTSDEAAREFVRTDRPEWVRRIDDAVPGVERLGVAGYQLYRSLVPDGPPQVPGCIVVVTVEAEGPDWQRQWIDAVLAALEAEGEPHPGLISAHYHISTDGTRVLNYAEWIDEEAHRRFLERPAPAADRAQHPPGRRRVKRYHLHRNLARPLTLSQRS